MRYRFLTVVFMLCLAACGKNTGLDGQWIQEIPGMKGQFQGMLLKENGEARSINMHTLLYETWEKDGNKLILKGKSIGNGQTIAFDISYLIKKVDAGQLVLNNGGEDLVFIRKK